MGLKNRITNGYLHFLTMTVVDWVDVFTRPVYKDIIVDSLRYCQKQKGLEIYAWVLMTNHLHLIAASAEGVNLSGTIRDFKKFASKAVVRAIHEGTESRQDWMLHRFAFHGAYNPKIKDFKFWQDGNEAKIIFDAGFYEQKRNYIHANPVRHCGRAGTLPVQFGAELCRQAGVAGSDCGLAASPGLQIRDSRVRDCKSRTAAVKTK